MTQGKEKIALVINTASYERVSFGLGIVSSEAAMALHNLTKEELIDEVEVRGIVEFLREEAKAPRLSMFKERK